jgi:hypothetical protein
MERDKPGRRQAHFETAPFDRSGTPLLARSGKGKRGMHPRLDRRDTEAKPSRRPRARSWRGGSHRMSGTESEPCYRICYRTRQQGLVGSGTKNVSGPRKARQSATFQDCSGQAGTAAIELQNRCTATVLTRPASLNYNGYLNARSSATAVEGEIATQRLISARRAPK